MPSLSPPSTPAPTQLPWAPAEQGAASCSSSDHHRWAVQAMASGYSASQLTPFIASARRVRRSHEVDLLLFSNSESLELQRLAEQHAVSLVKFLQRPPSSNMPSFSLMLNPVAWRFVLASALIKVRAPCTLGWLVTDARDVIFQRHVFRTVPQTWLSNRTTLSLESRALYDPQKPGMTLPNSGLLNSTLLTLRNL